MSLRRFTGSMFTVALLAFMTASTQTAVARSCTLTIQASDDRQSLLSAFADLTGGKWIAEGKWANGPVFKQEHIYELGLGGKIVKVKTFDMDSADPTTGVIGLRNEGIRAWDDAEHRMKFWEFDRFGGITNGIVFLDQGTLYYEYDYRSGGNVRKLRDAWTRVNRDRYSFKSGIFEEGQWKRVLLEATFNRVTN